MITHRIIQLPFGPPTAYFVRTTKETQITQFFFFKKKIKEYSDSPIFVLSQLEEYIKENNIEISKAEFW